MNLIKNIESMTSFRRRTDEYLKQMDETGEPLILTVNGRARCIVLTPDAFQALSESYENVEIIRSAKTLLDREMDRPMEDFYNEFEKENSL